MSCRWAILELNGSKLPKGEHTILLESLFAAKVKHLAVNEVLCSFWLRIRPLLVNSM